MKRQIFLLTVVLCACVQFLGSRQAGLLNAGQDQLRLAGGDDVIWTKWDADHYALAEDGDSIWIGTASGLIRWNKAGGSYTRLGTAVGVLLGEYDLLLSGISNSLAHERPFRLIVVEHVYDMLLPVMAR